MASVRSLHGETVDQLALRVYGDTTMTARIYAANPGLADLGLVLPHGTPITLPPVSAPVKKRISLWD